MQHINVEIKARCERLNEIREILRARGAEFVGEDHQIDTYFPVSEGRFKLREGTIERSLIFYRRPNSGGPKRSEVVRYTPKPDAALKAVLKAALGVKVVVDKRREIYYIDNVKFHLDRVQSLGPFVEIEAVGTEDTTDEAPLRAQCEEYLDLFGIEDGDLVAVSYSDLLMKQKA